ncbi:MAG: hypothetical protein ACI4OP_02860 [Candidatus Coprovivens sp.]
MIIQYRVLNYRDANVDVDGIVKDIQYRGISQDKVTDDILNNYEYYLENYSDMPFDGDPDEESLYGLADIVIDKLNELQDKV